MTAGWPRSSRSAPVIWHQADAEPARALAATCRGCPGSARSWRDNRRSYLLRFIGGGLLVVVGIIGRRRRSSRRCRTLAPRSVYGLLFAAVALAGVGLALAPLLWRMFTQLREERVARIREQERAELAAMVHDQVLHTLALIQRNAGDAQGGPAPGPRPGADACATGSTSRPRSPTERFAAALEQAAAEVEDTYAIAVETVVVGDARRSTSGSRALVAAAREALVNAARHAKVEHRLALRGGRAGPAQRVRP